MDEPSRPTDRPLRLHHVVADIHRRDAGPSYSVVRLAEDLAALGHDVRLHTLEPRPDDLPNVATRFYPRLPVLRSLGISPAMRRGLIQSAEHADVMHVHGLWMMPNVYPGKAVKETACRLVHSPRGMLDPWAREWHQGRKRAFSLLFQDRALTRVDCFHATSEAEADAVRRAGYLQPSSVLPIGIDIPTDVSAQRSAPRVVVYLGRLHPKKNVDGLIRAWSRIESAHPDWSLEIAGPGDTEYVRTLRDLVRQTQRVKLLPAAYGAEKDALLRRAHLFVLPTHSENFGIVVAEALSYAIPVIVSKGAPWHDVVEQSCGWWVDNDDAALALGMSSAMKLQPGDLAQAGKRGRSWVVAAFSWPSIARRMVAVYRDVLTGKRPIE